MALAVDRLLSERRVKAHDDVVKRRQRFVGRPELEPASLDDAGLFGVNNLGMDLLSSKLRAFVLCDLSKEGLCKVRCVVIGRPSGDVNPAVLLGSILEQLTN